MVPSAGSHSALVERKSDLTTAESRALFVHCGQKTTIGSIQRRQNPSRKRACLRRRRKEF
jgi:hypothetical protein